MKQYRRPWLDGPLAVSANGRYLTNGDIPFFWLGDTAWTLLQRLDEEQAAHYLRNRADKGFNVIQAVLVNFRDHNGKTSLQRMEACDVTEVIAPENEAYWRHVDRVLDLAEELGVYMALLPAWGKVLRDNQLREDNAAAYADFLIRRFGGRKNVIWILGGDIRGSAHFALWNAFGARLRQGCPDILIGYHPVGRTSSSYWFNDCGWLDFHMFQSGHRRGDQKNMFSWDEAAASEPWYGEANWRYAEHDRALSPARPVLDGEPSYEQIPQGLHDGAQPRWLGHHVRRYAWWSVLSGACGHTYGHVSIFQFFGTGYAPEFFPLDSWDTAIHHSGSAQVGILKRIAGEIGYERCAPMSEIVACQGEGDGYIPALGNGREILLYDYSGRSFRLCGLGDREFDMWWINPVDGVRSYGGRRRPGSELSPPPKKEGHNDWALLLTCPGA